MAEPRLPPIPPPAAGWDRLDQPPSGPLTLPGPLGLEGVWAGATRLDLRHGCWRAITTVTVFGCPHATDGVPCPRCARAKPKFAGEIDDLQWFDVPHKLEVFFHPGPCRGAKRLVWPAGISPGYRATLRLIEAVAVAGMTTTLSAVAERYGCDRTKIADIVTPTREMVLADYRPVAGRIIGIDGIHPIFGPATTVVNLDHARAQMIELIPGHGTAAVQRLAEILRGLDGIVAIVIDGSRSLRRALRKWFPGKLIVTDPYHLIRRVMAAMMRVRRSVKTLLPIRFTSPSRGRKEEVIGGLLKSRYGNLKRPKKGDPSRSARRLARLEEIFACCPLLKAAYWYKEQFGNLWLCATKEAASEYLDYWLDTTPDGLDGYFAAAKRHIREWRQEILAWWDVPCSTGPVEAIQRLLKARAGAGRGQADRETVRAWGLFSGGAIPEVDIRTAARKVAFHPRRSTVRERTRRHQRRHLLCQLTEGGSNG